MFQRIVVPADGSSRSLDAVRHAAVLAAQCDAPLEVVQVVPWMTKVAEAHRDLKSALDHLDERHGTLPARAAAVIIEGDDDVATAVAKYADEVDGTMIVLSSTGRGRSAAVLGSVADDLVRSMFGPLIVVGPNVAEPRSLSGVFVVPVDGSSFAKSTLPLAGAWGIALGATPWVLEVLAHDAPGSRSADTDYTSRLAGELHELTERPVESATVRADDPARAIAEFAVANDASLIMMSTHGRTGLKRLTAGSVASATVREAPCPVVLHRPPELRV